MGDMDDGEERNVLVLMSDDDDREVVVGANVASTAVNRSRQPIQTLSQERGPMIAMFGCFEVCRDVRFVSGWWNNNPAHASACFWFGVRIIDVRRTLNAAVPRESYHKKVSFL